MKVLLIASGIAYIAAVLIHLLGLHYFFSTELSRWKNTVTYRILGVSAIIATAGNAALSVYLYFALRGR